LKKNHLLIVDDHPMVQEGLVSLLSNHKRIGQISTADCGKNALQLLSRENIDLVFLDINLPDTNGIDLCYKITKEYENTKVVAVSSFNNKSFFKKIIDNGGKGYLLKNSTSDEIVHAVDQILDGKIYFSIDVEKEQKKDKILLTRREIDILEQITEGLSNQQIADKLFISVHTVNTHRKTILAKFEANNTVMLLKKAREMGYLL
jgi:DNA-binding NarL/FixJ family response regulator